MNNFRTLMRCLVAALAVLGATGCLGAGGKQAAPEPPKVPYEDPIQVASDVETTLVRFSLALADGDAVRLRDLTSDHFALLDEGRVYDLDGLVQSARASLAGGSMIRTPVDFTTEVRRNVAWTHYHVVGEFRTESKRTLLSLLESAVLERSDGRWRIAQMSTQPETVAP